jgi:hypothetical protein
MKKKPSEAPSRKSEPLENKVLNFGSDVAQKLIVLREELSPEETTRLNTLEGTIRAGEKAFIRVGEALAEIRDSRLYRSTHTTFADYFRDRWDMCRSRAYQLIEGAATAKHLSTIVDTPPPTSESQLRPLARLLPDQKGEAYANACEVAGGAPPTAKQVKAAVDKRKPPKLHPSYRKPLKPAAEELPKTSKSLAEQFEFNADDKAPPLPSNLTVAPWFDEACRMLDEAILPLKQVTANTEASSLEYKTAARAIEQIEDIRQAGLPPYTTKFIQEVERLKGSTKTTK